MAVIASETAPSLPYHEPAVVTILVQTSFLLLLNVVNAALDRILYCGLLGQVLVGIAWGTPGAKWLSVDVEEVVVQLGYLGLILLVFEGAPSPCLHASPSLTTDRRPIYIIQISQSQLSPLLRCCHHRHCYPNCSFLLSP